MPDTTSSALTDSLNSIVASARIVREQVGQDFISTVDRKQLPMGTGNTWREVDLSAINSQAVPEGSKLDNAQQLVDTVISVEPTRIGIHVVFTPEAEHFTDRKVWAERGELLENANRRRIDRDGVNVYDGATVTGGGTGTTLNSGIVAAMVAQIQGDTNESAKEDEEIFLTLHGFQIYDLRTEITGGIATYPLPAGMTTEAYAQGSKVIREVGGARMKRNNNVRVDATPDGHGGVHARSGIVLVQVSGKERLFTDRLKNQGGALALWLYDWYGYLERSAGNWVKRILTDSTAPTTG